MFYRSSTVALALAATMMAAVTAQAADDAKYPNWKGQWAQILTTGVGGQNVRFDPTKAFGPAQQAPLTPEYQKVHAASMADQAQGGLGNYPTARCLPGGMPRMMTAAQEYVITPETTYIIVGGGEDHLRRVFTDGRVFPTDLEPRGRPVDARQEGSGAAQSAIFQARATPGSEPRRVAGTERRLGATGYVMRAKCSR